MGRQVLTNKNGYAEGKTSAYPIFVCSYFMMTKSVSGL